MTNIEKLQTIIEEAKELKEANITSANPRFQAWKNKVYRFLIAQYGKQSYEYIQFEKTSFSLYISDSSTTEMDFILACRNGLEKTIIIFNDYLEELKDDNVGETETVNYDFSKVFIVHGHDSQLKESVARLIDKQPNMEAIILSEQRNRGKTLIEKLETHSNVGGAICLFSADDVGKAKKEMHRKNRARQNVVFEAGYFMGKLGRDHIIIVADKAVELPSDLNGILYTDKGNWEHEVLAELNAMGYDIDFSKK